MRILVSGSKGFLGMVFTEKAKRTNDVYQINRSRSIANTFDLHFPNGVIFQALDFESLGSKLVTEKIEQCINLAGAVHKGTSYSEIQDLVDANIHFVCKLAELSVRIGCKRITTTSTFSKSTDGLTYSPQSLYAATKQAGDDLLAFYAKSRGLEVVGLDVYDLYGPNQRHARIFSLLSGALISGSQLQLHGDGTQEVWPLFVDDAADAVLFAANLDSSKLKHKSAYFSVPGYEITTVLGLAEILSQILKKKWAPDQLVFGGVPLNKVIEKARPLSPPLLGWSAQTSLEKGLRKSIG